MDYFSSIGDGLFMLRLLIEGACDVYETEAAMLFRLGIREEQLTATVAFDTIGAALSEMRIRIREMQLEHTKEAMQKTPPSVNCETARA